MRKTVTPPNHDNWPHVVNWHHCSFSNHKRFFRIWGQNVIADLDTFQIPVRLIWPRSNKWDNLRVNAIKQDFDVARDDILLLKSTYRQLFPKHTRHSKFVGLCGGGGNTGPARSRASGQCHVTFSSYTRPRPVGAAVTFASLDWWRYLRIYTACTVSVYSLYS